MSGPALGLIETKGIGGALQATRAASDTGEVVIVSAEQTEGDRMTVKIEGEWSAVQAAVEAGARAAFEAGEFIAMHVIPRPDNGVSPILPYRRFVARYNPDLSSMRPHAPKAGQKTPPARAHKQKAAPEPTPSREPARPKPPTPARPAAPKPAPSVRAPRPLPMEELEGMAVVKLRKYARTIENLPIKGREISRANKQELLEAIASVSLESGENTPDNGDIPQED
jgi:microcompartment protein CcmL/EutN